MESSPDELRRAIAVLAHELRNPLSVFRAGVDLLPDEHDEQKRLKNILLRQTVHMTRVVEDLSDISRAQLGKLRIERHPLHLADVIGDAAESIQPKLAARRQQLDLEMNNDSIWIDGDGIRIGQLLSNLLSNASKYSDPESPIQLVVTAEAGEVVIRVRDFGIGIASEDLERVFNFLSQCDSQVALRHREGGLGIGLALARQIVQQHDGTITAHSEGLGKGSEFTVHLPTIEADDPQRKSGLEQQAFSSRRVLVVDDNRSSQFLVPSLVGRLGSHEVQVAGNGEMALEALGRFTPDLILLDLGLPDMSGIELAQIIRENESLAKTRIVALTGYDDEDSRGAASDIGIDAYYVKPVSIAMLRQVFETLMRSEQLPLAIK